uniref:Uncharacterized protein n=1 Tax=Xenopus tropicalis TaxID=8364 RepID=A0A6I8R364_XENTR
PTLKVMPYAGYLRPSLNKRDLSNPFFPILQKPPNDAPTYDTVAEVPVYAVVDKAKQKKTKEENIHYADIEVLRRPTTNTSKRKPDIPPKPEATEYASINFPKEYNPVKGTLV